MASNSQESDAIDQHPCDYFPMNISSVMDSDAVPDSSYQFRFYACGPLLTVFILVGLLGNSACLYVFKPFRPGGTAATPPIYVYLFTLAVWDLTLLCSSFLLYNLPEWSRGFVLNDPHYASSRPYLYFITNAAHTNSNWIVVALGLERYLALCYPFRHWLMDNSRRRATYLVYVISVAGVLYNLPRLFEVLYEFGSVPECVLSEDGHYVEVLSTEQATVRQNFFYRTFYKVLGGTLFYSVGPFLCLLIVSIRVSAAIRQQRIFQTRLQETHDNDRSPSARQPHCRDEHHAGRDHCSHSINIMLVAVVIKLLFVHSLPTGLDVAETVMGDEAFSNDPTVDYLITFLTLLLAINCSSNFFIYYACSKTFRRDLQKAVVCSRECRVSDRWEYCCRGRYQEACVITGLTSTVIINEDVIKRDVRVDHV